MSPGLIDSDPHPPPRADGSAPRDGAAPGCEDERLADSIRQALRGSGYTVLGTIGVTVRAGSVALGGTVPSYFMKQIAQEVAKATAGVRSLTNRLTVRAPSVDPIGSDPGTSPGKGYA